MQIQCATGAKFLLIDGARRKYWESTRGRSGLRGSTTLLHSFMFVGNSNLFEVHEVRQNCQQIRVAGRYNYQDQEPMSGHTRRRVPATYPSFILVRVYAK